MGVIVMVMVCDFGIPHRLSTHNCSVLSSPLENEVFKLDFFYTLSKLWEYFCDFVAASVVAA